MNILWIYDAPLVPEKGGTERASFLVMEELRKRGHQCFGFLVFNQKNPSFMFYEHERVSSLNDFLCKKKIDLVVNQIAFASWLLKAFFENGGDEWKMKGGKIISFMHFDPKFPQISMHDLLWNWKNMNFIQRIKRLVRICVQPYYNHKEFLLHKNGYKYNYKKSDVYVLLSDHFKPQFLRISELKSQSKIFVIPNSLTFPTISNLDSLSKKELIVLIVSRLEEHQKKLSTIFRSWEILQKRGKLGGFQLWVVGTGPDEKYFKSLVARKSLEKVTFWGHQSPLKFYEKAVISCMSSPNEGWGLTLTESLQTGVVPVVLNTSPVFQDIIIDGKTGFLATSKNDFTEKLQILMNDKTLRETMAKNALRDVQRFSSQNVGNLWENLLANL